MLAHQGRDALVDLVPLLVGADGGQRGGRDLDGEVELAQVPGVDEVAVAAHADEEKGHGGEGLQGGRETEALHGAPGAEGL